MTENICLQNFEFLPRSVCPYRSSEKDRGRRGDRGRWAPRPSAKKAGEGEIEIGEPIERVDGGG